MAKMQAPKMPKAKMGKVKAPTPQKSGKGGGKPGKFPMVGPTTVTPGVDMIKKRMKGK